MIPESLSASSDCSRISSPLICPCQKPIQLISGSGTKLNPSISIKKISRRRKRGVVWACVVPIDGRNQTLGLEFANSVTRGLKNSAVRRISDELDEANDSISEDSIQLGYSNDFNGFREDPIVGKLRTQLGVIHPIPAIPINRNIAGLFVFFFIIGVVFDKLWTSRKKMSNDDGGKLGIWPQVPTSFSLFLEKDLQRKESVEWVNMVLGKLWKVYRGGLESWVTGLLQPVIDDLKKPDYVERVVIKQFSLGDEPFVVRNVERRTSRSVNDLQYQIGLRYTGGARMLLMLTLKFGIIPIKVPVGVRDFDIDGELWVKLRLIPTEPWVGAVSWAFVSLPKIKFELSPFRLFNLMGMFLKKLLTEDLPRLFVRPKKIVLDFQKGKAVGPVQNDFNSAEMQEGNKDFAGELSVTLLGDQVVHSKKNSKTTVTGPPGQPIWNQDFSMLVTNPRKQKLSIQVKESLGFLDLTVGAGEVDLGSLEDTVPTDRIVTLQGGWGLWRKGSAGEILLRLTYKAYVEDEEDEKSASDDEFFELQSDATIYDPSSRGTDKESFMDVLAALIVSEEFQGIVASETASSKSSNSSSDMRSTTSPRATLEGFSKLQQNQMSVKNSGEEDDTGSDNKKEESENQQISIESAIDEES
ncbi:C2 calcium/lipid-binding domain, CaLB [Cynara cardunculus var. scolymus]|uniref:C2 calcium/lipid-binding domain, CaLB n=1 Tax=Cynara cardunculus var. scolymus TaxID=59895 RepID=A0A103YA20_CYNCS|nr:C2 calcium/lipid-binding domain, CaLB [Cynara cardunculus var. scolymus]